MADTSPKTTDTSTDVDNDDKNQRVLLYIFFNRCIKIFNYSQLHKRMKKTKGATDSDECPSLPGTGGAVPGNGIAGLESEPRFRV